MDILVDIALRVLCLLLAPVIVLCGVFGAGYFLRVAWLGVQLVLWALFGIPIK